MQVIALVNQKGGCGKTTAAIHMGAALARAGSRVLLVDLDPQAHATLGLGCEGEGAPALHEVLSAGVPARDALRAAPAGMTLLPASPRLAEFEETSNQALAPESRLRRALAPLAREFDHVVLDCPPRADGVLTANALATCTLATLVVETGAFALQGALRALALLGEVARAQGSRFDVRVLATLFDRRTRFEREVLIALQARFGRAMFETAIRRDVRLREAVAHGVPVQEFAPRCHASLDFAALARELGEYTPTEGRALSEEDAALPDHAGPELALVRSAEAPAAPRGGPREPFQPSL